MLFIILLGVALAPTGGQCEVEVMVEEGSLAVLPCKTTVHPQHIHVSAVNWHKSSGGELTTVWRMEKSGLEFRGVGMGHRIRCPRSQFGQGDYSLHIDRVREEDGGVYVCVARDGRRSNSTEVTLRVIRVSFSLTDPVEGSNLTVTCSVTPQLEKKTLSWKLNGRQLPLHGMEPSLHGVTQREAGNWTCIVQHAQIKVEVTQSLRVKGIVTPLGDSTRVYAEVGSSATLPCVFTEGLTPGATRWERALPSLSLPPSFRKSSSPPSDNRSSASPPPWDASARVQQVEVGDGGVYRCSGTVEGLRVQRKMELVTARVLSSPPLTQNAEVTLTCHLSNASEVTEYEWLRVTYNLNGTQAATPVQSGEALKIPKVTEDDLGEWVCRFYGRQGMLGQASYHFHIMSGLEGERKSGDINKAATVTGLGFLFLGLLLIVLQMYKNHRRRRLILQYPALETIVHSNSNKREERQRSRDTEKEKLDSQ